MSILRFQLDNGFIYMHKWDDVENVNPRDYIIMQISQSYITKYISSIERCLGKCPHWLFNSLERILGNKAMRPLLSIVKTTQSIKPFDTIINESLKKSQQERLLKDISLTPEQILSILLYAGSKDYLLSHYSYRASTNKGTSFIAFKQKNGEIVSSSTTMADKELNYHMENDELINAFILSKGSKWFCLSQRKKGIIGKEPGENGGVPHIHFVSSAYGVKKEDVVISLKKGKMPHPSFHVKLTDYL